MWHATLLPKTNHHEEQIMTKQIREGARVKLDNLGRPKKELSRGEQKEVKGGLGGGNTAGALKDIGKLFQDMGSLVGGVPQKQTATAEPTTTQPSGATK